MAELQKLSTYQLDDLPEEVILKVLGFLDIKELPVCDQVSQRLRAISNDESLWLKLNLFRSQPPLRQQLPYDFIEKALENGCQYLSLAGSGIQHLTGKSEFPYNLKYLNMSQNMSQNMYKKRYQKLSQKVMKNSQGLPKNGAKLYIFT